MTHKPFAFGLIAILLFGCAPVSTDRTTPSGVTPTTATPTTQPAQPTAPAAVASRPLLLHLPGIGGTRSIDYSMLRGFQQGGFDGDIEIYDWTEGDTGIDALRSTERNRREAQLIANQIVAQREADPSRTIYLTCHSGGAGLAVWALEDLPPTVHIRSIVFMSPALSPTYDLTRALRHVDQHAYVFSSLADTIVLGYGTRVFGTIDGVKTDAAGRVGFHRPPAGDPDQYGKLVSLPYSDNWVQFHNFGDHVGGMTRQFGQGVLMPLLLSGILPPIPPLAPTTAPGIHIQPPAPATLPHPDRGNE